MAANMAVSVTLRLQDQLTGPLRAVTQHLQQFGRAAQDVNRISAGTGISSQFNRLHGQLRGLAGEIRNLGTQFNQLGRSIAGAGAGGGFAQRQITDMRTLIALQQQAIANNARMVAGPAGPAGVPGLHGPHGPGGRTGPWSVFGRSGFNPNASLADRFQYRGVNLLEQALATGTLDFDRARTQLQLLGLPAETIARAEAAAREYATVYRSLSPGHILDTFREIITQFQNPEDAFRFLPHLLRIQDWQVLGGDTIEQAREGMLRLVRAIGLSGRLVGPGGEFTETETAGVLDAYLRARMIGGRDVTPDQAFQFLKYLKTTGQTLSTEALLEGFIAMPDIRGSTMGNQLNQMVIQLTGRATQAAQRAMVAAGLGRITASEASGPHSFRAVDEEMLRSNPFEWFQRHIVGPGGYLRRSGIDPLRAPAAQIAAALRPMFSNQSAENIANMIVNQRQEWQNQIRNALRLNLSEEAQENARRNSLWYGLVAARSQIMNALGTIANAFKFILLPPIQMLATGLQNLAALVSPQTGNPYASTGMVAGGLLGGFWLLRALARGMGPLSRTLLGGGLGLAFGGVGEAMMGALLLRGMGAQTAGALGALGSGAAGAAATAAGMTLGRRILAALGLVMRRIPGFLVLSGVIAAIQAVADNWETVKPRILSVWEDLTKALPTWLGGQGDAAAHARLSRDLTETMRTGVESLHGTLSSSANAFEDWFRSTPIGQYFIGRGLLPSAQALALERLGLAPWGGAATPDLANPIGTLRTGQAGNSITTGPINVTVNVTQPTNADPATIGAAAGNAVHSQLRRLLGDSADTVPYGGH